MTKVGKSKQLVTWVKTCYLSKNFSEYESKYSTLEKTCCALVWATKRLQNYLLYYMTLLTSRMDSLKYLIEKPIILRSLARWHILLATFEITYVTQKSVTGQAITYHLVENSIEEYEPMADFFPNESIISIETKEEYPTDVCTWMGQLVSTISELMLCWYPG